MSGRELTEDDFVFIPIDVATTPPEGIIEHLKDRWWSAHPEKGLAFYNPQGRTRRRMRGTGSPQCNSNETITRRIARSQPWDAVVVFLPSVFVRIDISDYTD